jgi:hypothetical protein
MFKTKSTVLPLPISSKIEDKKILNDKYINIISFILSLFIFLKEFNMCFLSGTIIFEDDNNKLFNLLTYGTLEIEKCDINKALAIPHITTTHINVFEKKGVESNEDCFKLNKQQKKLEHFFKKCENNKCFKMELIFNNKINFLCDILSKEKQKQNKFSKKIILFYRFKYNDKKYLFFKLEEFPMVSFQHLGKFLNQKRKDTYEKRRENENSPSYNSTLKNIDDDFYKKLLHMFKENDKKLVLDKINNYNEELRTGRELFIIDELKEMLMNDFLDINIKKLNLMIELNIYPEDILQIDQIELEMIDEEK